MFRQRSCTFGGVVAPCAPFSFPLLCGTFCALPAFGGRSLLALLCPAFPFPAGAGWAGAGCGGGVCVGRCCAAAAGNAIATVSPSPHHHPPSLPLHFISKSSPHLHLCVRILRARSRVVTLHRLRQITQRLEVRQHVVILQHRQITHHLRFLIRTRIRSHH